MTSLIRLRVESSTPFISETITASGCTCGAQLRRLSRKDCDGVAHTTTSAPSSAASTSCVARTLGGSSMLGR